MLESSTTGHGTIKKLRTGAVISTLAISALGVSTSVSASETEVAVNEPATRVVAKDEVASVEITAPVRNFLMVPCVFDSII